MYCHPWRVMVLLGDRLRAAVASNVTQHLAGFDDELVLPTPPGSLEPVLT
jgi:hypothetical protein